MDGRAGRTKGFKPRMKTKGAFAFPVAKEGWSVCKKGGASKTKGNIDMEIRLGSHGGHLARVRVCFAAAHVCRQLHRYASSGQPSPGGGGVARHKRRRVNNHHQLTKAAWGKRLTHRLCCGSQ